MSGVQQVSSTFDGNNRAMTLRRMNSGEVPSSWKIAFVAPDAKRDAIQISLPVIAQSAFSPRQDLGSSELQNQRHEIR